ncbi:MAG TPA: hypothetical protein VJ951_05530, partial [Bacteroidales bacterium]|nr:hypothetical protein [Bacteroidales bacterium]
MKKTFTLLILFVVAIVGHSQNLNEDFLPLLKGPAEVRAMALQQDGKMILTGNFITVDSSFVEGLVRINPDGTLDPSFQFTDEIEVGINDIHVLENNKILIGGQFENSHLDNLMLLNEDGTIDRNYNYDVDIVFDFAVQSDGKIVVAHLGDNLFTRLNSDGSIDETFLAEGTVNSLGTFNFTVKTQPDDKIVVAGVFDTYNNMTANGVVRLNADGTLDTGFDAGTGPSGGSTAIRDIGIQSDDKIVLVGDFENFNDLPTNNIIRLNSDGSVDETFFIAGQLASLYTHPFYTLYNLKVLNNDELLLIVDIPAIADTHSGNSRTLFSKKFS